MAYGVDGDLEADQGFDAGVSVDGEDLAGEASEEVGAVGGLDLGGGGGDDGDRN